MSDIYTLLGYDKATLQSIVDDIDRYYITYRIKKRNGKTRRIDAPQEPLKTIQKIILEKFLYKFRAHPIAHGFVHGRSPKTNSELHTGKDCIITVDIKNFFNSIKHRNVVTHLQWLASQNGTISLTEDDATLLASLMCFKHVLPQGAPTSPVMSNLICLGMDRALSDVAKVHGATISRYADDIAISGTKDLYAVVPNIYAAIYSIGLRPHKGKTKIRKYYQRQQITGVVVNKKPNVRKEIWRNLRAQLHNLKSSTIDVETFQQLRGKIEWIKSLNPCRGAQLLKALSLITVK